MMKLAGIILAAGESARFGGRKQLALIDGKPMICHAIDQLLPVLGDNHLHVVLGAFAGEIAPHLPTSQSYVVNEDWQAGMGSSIAAGINAICRAGDYDGVLIALADQAKLQTLHYQKLCAAFDGQHIIASHYGNKNGVPAIFPKSLFNDLAVLAGQEGAKSILQKHAASLLSVPMDDASFDIDYRSDLDRLNQISA
ncbi:hypothetical protein COO20_25090 [Thalassospira marina]|uniref:MobA-like NTP transferase domain-containing protein n=2 Tax=Thalassospira marina TaxID=2048283 RepID=A0A2N3KBW5_9PROT|nr:hypothetical protein COO20_25090 [Thalassospira marina]